MAFTGRLALHTNRAAQRRRKLWRVVEAIEATAATRTESAPAEHPHAAALSHARHTQLDNLLDRLTHLQEEA